MWFVFSFTSSGHRQCPRRYECGLPGTSSFGRGPWYTHGYPCSYRYGRATGYSDGDTYPPARVVSTATETPPPATATPVDTPEPTPTPPFFIDANGRPRVSPFPPPTGETPVPQGSDQPVTPGFFPEEPDGLSPRWGCDGDERMDFTPLAPRVGERLFVFVTAFRDRAFGLMIGPDLSGVQGQNIQGGRGLKKRWDIVPGRPGSYNFHFYGGPYPEHLCVSASVEVVSIQAVVGTATATGTPAPMSSPRPDH